jgi:hypothetical protein
MKLPYAGKAHPCKGSVRGSRGDGFTDLTAHQAKVRVDDPRADARMAPSPREAKRGLRIESRDVKSNQPIGEGVALTSMAHPPALIDKIADAIRSGKLTTKPNKLKRGRPKIEGPRPWELAGMSKRTWHRRQKDAKK